MVNLFERSVGHMVFMVCGNMTTYRPNLMGNLHRLSPCATMLVT